ncbi:MAG: hypothetical protein IPL39_07325 [Opitutaceae bacterium]|nr:hypothetical protein [Opitutaceae bacterium]
MARPPRARLAHLGLLVGWLLATGMHLDVLQLYAWTTMGFRFARTESVGEAFASTFKGERMCHLCHAVVDARKQQRAASALPTEEQKAVIVFLALPVIVLVSPPAERWPQERVEWIGVGRPRPPLPPPRGLA